MEQPREEAQILEDLATLAASTGYVHAVAHIFHRDNVIHIKGKLKPSDMDRLYSRERLIRTELTTLIGLMAKKPLDLSQQPSDVVEAYIKRTDFLMEELHNSMSYGDRLIILQAKAKKLTIAARKGNDNQLKADFAAAIQGSHDQGWTCANAILAGGCRLVDDKEKEVDLPPSIKEVYLFSLVSEHYPALAFQARQSLKFQTTDVIRPPFVMDVFLLDTLTEMLATPLRLLGYVKLRVAVSDKLMSGHELTVLGYHLTQNLWLDEKHDLVMLEDSIARDLDAAMMVRRDNQPGDDAPVGILTKMRGTRYESLIKEIEASADPATLELGFHLLSMDEDSCRNVHRVLEIVTRKAQIDGKRYAITLASSTPTGGVSFHCNATPSPEAIAVLETHCAKRKYQQRAAQWFGVSVSPTGQVQFGVTLDFPWEASEEMERFTADMKPATKVRDVLPQYSREVSRMKLGRNDPCHCGSGLKYKKCCLR